MRIAAIILALGLSLTAAAQEATPSSPDYSRDRLRQILAANEEPERERGIEFLPGAILFRALGMRYQFNAFAAPLPGSVRKTTGFDVDPFALTGTEIAQTSRTWVSRSAVSSELRRIQRTERDRAKIRVTQ